jgi:putative hemolysin
MWSDVLVILALVLVNGLLSGAEIAIVTLRKTRLQALVDEGKATARAVSELRSTPERFLATVQVGITVVSAAAAVYSGDSLQARFVPSLSRLPVVGQWAEELAFVGVVAFVSYLSLILGELVPKSLALRAPERYALLLGRPLLGLAQMARPIVWFLTSSSNIVLRIFRDRTSFTEARISPDELKAMLEEAGAGGALDPRASEIASRAIELSELVAADVMVPRAQMVALEKGASLEDVRAAVASSGHSRIVVYEGSSDNVVGYVSVRDAFTKGTSGARATNGSVSEWTRAVTFIPETMRAIDVLNELQQKSSHLAIVVDEHGGTAGLLTREDLVEEVVGEMLSEHVRARKRELRVAPDGTALVSGLASIRDVNRSLDLSLPEGTDDGDTWTTISGLCTSLLGRIPEAGAEIQVEGARLYVVDASPRRVRTVRIVPARALEAARVDVPELATNAP